MSKNKIVVAYSGGLDTSVMVKWLKDNYDAEIITFTGNLGQTKELVGLEEKAVNSGASKVYIEDLTKEFLEEYAFPLSEPALCMKKLTQWRVLSEDRYWLKHLLKSQEKKVQTW